MIRHAYFNGRWGQLHIARAGQGGVPLLLLHQSPVSGAMFDPALPLLAEAGFDVVAVDTPGYGRSTPPPAPVSIADYGAAIGDVLDALGWDNAAVLGHHTGAAIGASFAVQAPHRVTRLILNGVPLLSAEERAHFEGFRFAALEPQPDGSHLTAAWNQRIAATPGWTHIAAMHKHCVEMLANPDRYWWAFRAAFAHDMAADLVRLACPTLIFSNTGEDLYAASQRAHAMRPDFAFAALDGGTHDIVDEQPQAWVAVVAKFLGRA